MARQHLKCQKCFVDEPENPHWRVIVEEADLIAFVPKPWRVRDITHHETEALADEWLKAEWSIEKSIQLGQAVEFTNDDS